MSAEEMKAEESQYIAAVVPNFNTVFGGCSPPLTAGQKWSLVYHGAIVPFTIALDAVVAGSDEITGSHNGYGWGPEGYFKRFGAEYADTVSAGVIGNGLLPVLLHQDPRFYQLGVLPGGRPRGGADAGECGEGDSRGRAGVAVAGVFAGAEPFWVSADAPLEAGPG
jgi:hypothetical protein